MPAFTIRSTFRPERISDYFERATKFVVNNTVERMIGQMQTRKRRNAKVQLFKGHLAGLFEGAKTLKYTAPAGGNLPFRTGKLWESLSVTPGFGVEAQDSFLGVDYYGNGITTVKWSVDYAQVQHEGGETNWKIVVDGNYWATLGIANFKFHLEDAASTWRTI